MKRSVIIGAALFVASAAVCAAFLSGHVWINVTRSMPLGLYWVAGVHRPIHAGEIVLACAPAHAHAERYTVRGSCRGGSSPLLKHVVATAGARVAIDVAGVVVDGRRLPSSTPLYRDGRGRKISWEQQRVRLHLGQLWLYAPQARSFDSRYFGPISNADVLGVAYPILTEHT
jgi:conjugative transfer signal peptidase TraF